MYTQYAFYVFISVIVLKKKKSTALIHVLGLSEVYVTVQNHSYFKNAQLVTKGRKCNTVHPRDRQTTNIPPNNPKNTGYTQNKSIHLIFHYLIDEMVVFFL